MYAPLGSPNTYQQAISAVGDVLEPYDTDKLYPVLGFGAKLKDPNIGKYGSVQHCFPVYGGGLEVQGVQGILQVRDQGQRGERGLVGWSVPCWAVLL